MNIFRINNKYVVVASIRKIATTTYLLLILKIYNKSKR